eukprot:6455593-Amphidinium_carterae.8
MPGLAKPSWAINHATISTKWIERATRPERNCGLGLGTKYPRDENVAELQLLLDKMTPNQGPQNIQSVGAVCAWEQSGGPARPRKAKLKSIALHATLAECLQAHP